MKPAFSKPRHHAFTLLELTFILVIIVVVWVGVLLPAMDRPRGGCGARINCASNLKQVGIAFRVWAYDHDDKFPWLLSTNKGGTLENDGEVFRHFQIASNEISNPGVLTCRSDRRHRATNFLSDQFSNTNLSYFVGLDADQARPQMILSGDRNITGGTRTAGQILVLTTNSLVGWGTNLHNGGGNIGLADGSVQQLTSSALSKSVESALIPESLESFRLAIP
jgi:prepilin-type processing-associated H-X9-DG protein